MRVASLTVVAFAAWLLSPQPPRVVFVGDSITALAPWGDLCPGALNLGTPSATVAEIRQRVARERLPSRFVAVVMGGINDVVRNRSADETAADLRGLVDDLRARGAYRVIVHPVLPTTPAFPRDLRHQIAAVNAALPGDVAAFTVPAAAYKGDGVHLRPAGYRHWLAALRARGVCR